jgi:hypothetical protein
LSDFTGFSIDKKQLSPEGWSKTNFNFNSDRSIACFYGCQESDFALKFLTLSNSLYTGGFGGKSGDSEKPDNFVSNWVAWGNEAIYYLDNFGVDIYKRPYPGYNYGVDATDPTSWINIYEQAYEKSKTNDFQFSTNVGINPAGNLYGHQYKK